LSFPSVQAAVEGKPLPKKWHPEAIKFAEAESVVKNPEKQKTEWERTLAYYQAFLSPVVGEFCLFVNEFETLKPTLTDSVRNRFIQNPYLPYHTLMIALASQCGIRAHQLLDGKDGLEGRKKVPPSLRLLVHPFLEENQAEYGKRLDRFASAPPHRPDLVLHLEDAPAPFALRTRLNQQTNNPEKQKQDFWRRVEVVRQNWAFLEKERKKLEDPRNQVFAHLELERGTIEFVNSRAVIKSSKETFEAFRSALRLSLGDLCQTFEIIIPRIGNCLVQLAFILVRANLNVQKFRQLAIRASTAFWNAQRVD
jgi:hypothetical protein